jgi:membrane fusion protein (multidrug efflux system)
LPVPQTSTYEIQDKIFVYTVGDSNKVIGKQLHIVGKTTDYYLVDKGVQPGDKIVFAGMDRLTGWGGDQPAAAYPPTACSR